MILFEMLIYLFELIVNKWALYYKVIIISSGFKFLLLYLKVYQDKIRKACLYLFQNCLKNFYCGSL